jgi:tetratricopeptide (TPR) repeat protein
VRDVFPGVWDKRDLTEIRLPPLTKRGSEQLVRSALGADVDHETVAQIVSRAGGNAYYLEELVRSTVDGRTNQLPDTVLAMSQERLIHLDTEARRVLRAASVFGQTFWPPGLLMLLGEPASPERLDEWLEVLVAEELVSKRDRGNFPDTAEYRFRHSLVREAAYATLTDDDRRLGHRLAADWLVSAGEQDPVVLAGHLKSGGEAARAIAFYQRAAEEALDGHDVVAAIQWTKSGAEAGAEGEQLGMLQLLSARAHYWKGDFNGVRESATVAVANLAPGGARWCYAMRNAVQANGKLGEHANVEALADELLATKPLTDDDARALAAYLGALAVSIIELLFAGRRDRIVALFERIDHGETQVGAERPGVTAAIHAARAFERLYDGDLGGYLHHTLQGVLHFELAGDQRVATLYRINVAYALNEIGAFERARETLREALGTARRMGLGRLVALAKNNLGITELYLGYLEEARKLEKDAIEAYRQSGNKRMEGASRRNLAAVMMEAAELEEAEVEATTAVGVLEVAPPLRAHALATLARIQLRRGAIDDALATIESALAITSEIGELEEGETEILLIFAEVLRAAGRRDDACDAISDANDKLLERADKLREPSQRELFLTRVPDNARTIELFQKWTKDPY